MAQLEKNTKIKGIKVKEGEKQVLEVDKIYYVGEELSKILTKSGRAKIVK